MFSKKSALKSMRIVNFKIKKVPKTLWKKI